MKIYNDIMQGSEAWHLLRLGKMTASNAQAIATKGKGLDTYCRKIAAEIYTGITPETYTNANMATGVEEEQYARMAYEMETGQIVTEVGFIEYSEYVGSSPDGLINHDGGVEIKRKTFACHNDLILGATDFESSYIWQCHMNMVVSGRDWWDLVSYNPNFKNKSLFIKSLVKCPIKTEQLLEGFDLGIERIKYYLSILNN